MLVEVHKDELCEAYTASVNILAVEYLVKDNNPEEYAKFIEKMHKLDKCDLASLYIHLSHNMHTSSLGAMITQGDYDFQKEALLAFLEDY